MCWLMVVLHAKVHLGLSARRRPWILIGTQHDETLVTGDEPTSQLLLLAENFNQKKKLLGENLDQEILDDWNFGDEHIKTEFRQNLHSLGLCTWPLQPLQFVGWNPCWVATFSYQIANTCGQSQRVSSCFIWVAKEILVIAQRPDNNLGPRFHRSPGQMANIEFVGKEWGSLLYFKSRFKWWIYCMDEWWKTGSRVGVRTNSMSPWYDQGKSRD